MAEELVVLNFTVLDEENAPIAEAEVAIDGEVVAYTDENGEAAVEAEPNTEVEVAINADGYDTIEATIEVPEEAAEVLVQATETDPEATTEE